MALAGQKFLASVINEAAGLAKRRAAGAPRGKKAVEQRLVLTPDDAAAALREVRGCLGGRRGLKGAGEPPDMLCSCS